MSHTTSLCSFILYFIIITSCTVFLVAFTTTFQGLGSHLLCKCSADSRLDYLSTFFGLYFKYRQQSWLLAISIHLYSLDRRMSMYVVKVVVLVKLPSIRPFTFPVLKQLKVIRHQHVLLNKYVLAEHA